MQIRKFITTASRGLIEIRRDIKWGTDRVQFIHETVNDFLLRNRRLETLDRTLEGHVIGTSHERLMACCTSYLMMCELKPLPPGIPYYMIDKLAIDFPFLKYSSTSVFYHGEMALLGGVDREVLNHPLQRLCNGFERVRSFRSIFCDIPATVLVTKHHVLYALCLNGYFELVQLVLVEKQSSLSALFKPRWPMVKTPSQLCCWKTAQK